MSFWYTPAKERLAKGLLNLDTADLRELVVMTNTTAHTDQDAASLAAIGTLDEYNGTGYARVDLGDPTVVRDDVNDRAEISVPSFSLGTLGAGTRSAKGMIVYEFVDGTAANDRPIAYIDSGGFPFAGNGLPVNVTVNIEGLLQVQ